MPTEKNKPYEKENPDKNRSINLGGQKARKMLKDDTKSRHTTRNKVKWYNKKSGAEGENSRTHYDQKRILDKSDNIPFSAREKREKQLVHKRSKCKQLITFMPRAEWNS